MNNSDQQPTSNHETGHANRSRPAGSIGREINFPETWTVEKRLFVFIDQVFLPKSEHTEFSGMWRDLGNEDLKWIHASDFAVLLGAVLTLQRHSVRLAKIAALCSLTRSADRRHFRYFFLKYDPAFTDFDDHHASATFRRICYDVKGAHREGYSVHFSESLNRLDTYAFDYVYRSMADALGEDLPKALEVLLVPYQGSCLSPAINLCHVYSSLQGMLRSPLSAGSLLSDLARRTARWSASQSRERMLAGWFWLSAISTLREGLSQNLRRRLEILHELVLQPRTPFPRTATRQIMVAPSVSPVYPVYAPGGIECISWGVPAGFREARRSPYEPSVYLRFENATVFDDWTIMWMDGQVRHVGHGTATEETRQSHGILNVRLSTRRWRECGQRAGFHAIDISASEYKRLRGRFFLASSVRFMSNFGHFIYQSLPNISTYLNTNDDARMIAIDGPERPFHRPFLDLIGAPPDRVLFTDNNIVLDGDISFFEESFGPQISFIRVRELRKRVPKVNPRGSPFGKRIYLSRQHLADRRTGNEEEVQDFLRSRGFDIVVPDSHSALQQIQILENATVIVAPHGSALTNLIFCRDPKIIIEGHSKTTPNQTTYMYMLSNQVYWSKMQSKIIDDGNIIDNWNIDELQMLVESLVSYL